MISANLIYYKNRFDYINDDAIPNAIDYISRFNNKDIFYYGIWPPTKTSAITLFESLRFRNPTIDRYQQQIQHFWISFASNDTPAFINTFANDVALIFAPLFPICLATHDKLYHPHTHFVVSTTSILPRQKPLIGKVWNDYLKQVCQMALNRYEIHLTVIPKERTNFFQK